MLPACPPATPLTALLIVFAAGSLFGNCVLLGMVYCVVMAYHRLDTQTSSHLRNRQADKLEAEQLAERYKAERAVSHAKLLTTLLTVQGQLGGAVHSKDMRTETAKALTAVQSELRAAIQSSAGVLTDDQLKKLLEQHNNRFVLLNQLKGPGGLTKVIDVFAQTPPLI